MPRGVALFLTWTTYGTWLPGDRRGYVSETLKEGGGYQPRQNTPGTPIAADDPFMYASAQEAMKFPPVVLSRAQARWAAEGLIAAANEHNWRIVRGAMMATHAHLLLPLADDKPWWVQKVLKGRSAHFMSQQQGQTWRWWTAGGRRVILFDDRAVANVVRYIDNQPGTLAAIADNAVAQPLEPAVLDRRSANRHPV